MTYQEFKNKYNGKVIDYDGAYGGQCWDLGQVYFIECLGLSSSVLAGCGLVSNMLYGAKRKLMDKYFDEISTDNMCAGDVCIWEYGHIAIFDHWDGSHCWYLTQNPGATKIGQVNRGGMHAFRLKGSKTSTISSAISVGSKVQIATISPYKYYVADDVQSINGIYQVREDVNAGGKNAFDWIDNGIPEECIDLVSASGTKRPDSDRVHAKKGDKFVFNRTFKVVSTTRDNGRTYYLLDYDNYSNHRFWVIGDNLKLV